MTNKNYSRAENLAKLLNSVAIWFYILAVLNFTIALIFSAPMMSGHSASLGIGLTIAAAVGSALIAAIGIVVDGLGALICVQLDMAKSNQKLVSIMNKE